MLFPNQHDGVLNLLGLPVSESGPSVVVRSFGKSSYRTDVFVNSFACSGEPKHYSE